MAEKREAQRQYEVGDHVRILATGAEAEVIYIANDGAPANLDVKGHFGAGGWMRPDQIELIEAAK